MSFKCWKKVRYCGEQSAWKAAWMNAKKYKKHYEVYKCQECVGYHLATLRAVPEGVQ